LLRHARLPLLAILVFAMAMTGCENLGYYSQAAMGHLELMRARQPVAKVIEKPGTTPEVRDRLELSLRLLEFAKHELGLPADGQYATYVGLDRDAVVYNVMASPRFDLTPKVWCFPIAGCASYRGYFSRSAAEAKASGLAEQGFDVHVGGVAAYSTLGWFNDPLLSTFLHREEADFAELIFHELSHVLLFVPGDTAFNESFATFVGREGARRWLQQQDRTLALEAWEQRIEQRKAFTSFVIDWRARMARGFAEVRDQGADTAILEALREAFWADMRRDWAELDQRGYDRFFAPPASNARLNIVADYNIHLPAFRVLFDAVDGDFAKFYDRVRELAALDEGARRAELARLGATTS